MHRKHLILCGGLKRRASGNAEVHHLKLGKGKDMVHLAVDNITEKMVQDIPQIMHDLLEIATYIYCGDQNVSRGGLSQFEYSRKWNRCLYFEIPVREHDIWSDPNITRLLEETLSFLSDDTYSFKFHPMVCGKEPEFLDFKEHSPGISQAEEVVLFSGGLDSFAGALDELLAKKAHVILVSHQSNNKMKRLQHVLHEYLSDLPGQKQKAFHAPVMINKGKRLTRETSQRSRSFLYATLGAVVANMFGLSRVKFYENGVVSCNLPFDGQTPQARRTRSTHPKVLADLSTLFSELIGDDFVFENPYFSKTKTDVLEKIKELHHEP